MDSYLAGENRRKRGKDRSRRGVERLGHFGRQTYHRGDVSQTVTPPARSLKVATQCAAEGRAERGPRRRTKMNMRRGAARSAATRRPGWCIGCFWGCGAIRDVLVKYGTMFQHDEVDEDEYASRRGAKRRDATC